MTDRLGLALALALFTALPLSTAALEIACGLGLFFAIVTGRWRRFAEAPWVLPALAVALLWTVSVPAEDHLKEGIGHAWPLVVLVVVPALVTDARPVTTVALLVASGAAMWATAQRALGLPPIAGFSHHLSLAYALLPPFGVALAGRRWMALPLALGVLATDSEGATIALGVTALAVFLRRPAAATVAGAVAMVALLPLADPGELRQRAVLWTGGLGVAPPAGPGGYAAASAPLYDRLSPGFWFPNHAHDSAIQLLAVLGPAGIVATAWLALVSLGAAELGAAAGLAGVLVGGLTQDVLGDLEVARAAWAWVALTTIGNLRTAGDTN